MADTNTASLGVRIASIGAFVLPAMLVLVVALRSPVAAGDVEVAGSASADEPSDDAPKRAKPEGSAHRPSPSSKASGAAPSPTIDVSPGIASGESRATFEAMNHALAINDLKGALAKLDALLAIDPNAARDDSVRGAIMELTGRIMLVVGPEPDKMFDLIVNHMGTTGIDILYQLMTTKGGSRAANVAQKLLEREDVRAKGTEALRVAYGLRMGKSCDEKKALFAAARENGDGRSLGQLYLLNRRCGRRNADPVCCLNGDKDLDATIDALQKKGYQ